MKAGKKVEVGTHVRLSGEHESERVPCDDYSCPREHWERAAGPGTPYEPNVTGDDISVFRYHREAERTAIDAVVVGYETAPTAKVEDGWEDVGTFVYDEDAAFADSYDENGDLLETGDAARIRVVKERTLAYADEHGTPLRRRDDGHYEAMKFREVSLPWAKPKLLVLVRGNTQPWSVEYEDVEVAT